MEIQSNKVQTERDSIEALWRRELSREAKEFFEAVEARLKIDEREKNALL